MANTFKELVIKKKYFFDFVPPIDSVSIFISPTDGIEVSSIIFSLIFIKQLNQIVLTSKFTSFQNKDRPDQLATLFNVSF